jgi:hypothetical protein
MSGRGKKPESTTPVDEPLVTLGHFNIGAIRPVFKRLAAIHANPLVDLSSWETPELIRHGLLQAFSSASPRRQAQALKELQRQCVLIVDQYRQRIQTSVFVEGLVRGDDEPVTGRINRKVVLAEAIRVGKLTMSGDVRVRLDERGNRFVVENAEGATARVERWQVVFEKMREVMALEQLVEMLAHSVRSTPQETARAFKSALDRAVQLVVAEIKSARETRRQLDRARRLRDTLGVDQASITSLEQATVRQIHQLDISVIAVCYAIPLLDELFGKETKPDSGRKTEAGAFIKKTGRMG